MSFWRIKVLLILNLVRLQDSKSVYLMTKYINPFDTKIKKNLQMLIEDLKKVSK